MSDRLVTFNFSAQAQATGNGVHLLKVPFGNSV